MHARDLVDLAALVSRHAELLVEQRLVAADLEEYWVASKARFDRWARALRQLADAPQPTEAVLSLADEILTGELLARIWLAAAKAVDQRHQQCEVEPIARSIYLGQIEASNRLLKLMTGGVIAGDALKKAQAIRQRTERWCDVLLSQLPPEWPTAELAVDAERFADFAAEYQQLPDRRATTWALIETALGSAFPPPGPASPNADLNARLAGGVLACLTPEVFATTGLLRSLWSLRLLKVASDAEDMLGELANLDGVPFVRSSFARPARAQRRRI